VADNLEDTCLDNPRAREEFPAIVATAHRDGWLDSTFQARDIGPDRCMEPMPTATPPMGAHDGLGALQSFVASLLQAVPAPGANREASTAGGAALHSVAAYKAAGGAAVAEYFASGQVRCSKCATASAALVAGVHRTH